MCAIGVFKFQVESFYSLVIMALTKLGWTDGHTGLTEFQQLKGIGPFEDMRNEDNVENKRSHKQHFYFSNFLQFLLFERQTLCSE